MQPQMTPSRHEQALTKIALCIRDCPDTGGGMQLRRFLWSLYNQHHVLNLWTFVSRLDSERSALASEVLSAALVGNLKEDDIKRALLVAGEISRWEEAQPKVAFATTSPSAASTKTAISGNPPTASAAMTC